MRRVIICFGVLLLAMFASFLASESRSNYDYMSRESIAASTKPHSSDEWYPEEGISPRSRVRNELAESLLEDMRKAMKDAISERELIVQQRLVVMSQSDSPDKLESLNRLNSRSDAIKIITDRLSAEIQKLSDEVQRFYDPRRVRQLPLNSGRFGRDDVG